MQVFLVSVAMAYSMHTEYDITRSVGCGRMLSVFSRSVNYLYGRMLSVPTDIVDSLLSL